MPEVRQLLIAAFLGFVIVQTWLNGRLYEAARARQPSRFEPPYAWVDRVQAAPSALVTEVVRSTRLRLGLLGRRSEFPEVERLRLVALVAVAFAVAAFVLTFVN